MSDAKNSEKIKTLINDTSSYDEFQRIFIEHLRRIISLFMKTYAHYNSLDVMKLIMSSFVVGIHVNNVVTNQDFSDIIKYMLNGGCRSSL